MDHEAIYKAYAGTVVRISDSQGAFDADGNNVEIDQALVDAARSELNVQNAWKSLRTKRNQLLAETDYLALADHTLSADMTAYRQALRDLPSNTTDVANPVWPTKPGG
jgi:hypothetical protein